MVFIGAGTMSEEKEIERNCVTCVNSWIKDGVYLICDIDGIQNDVVENCKNYEIRIKELQKFEFRKSIEKMTDKQILRELKSYRKYMQSHSQYLDWANLNPDEINNGDRFNIIRDIVQERGLKEL